MTAKVYDAAGRIMRDRGRLHGVADEGGWWPEFTSNSEALDTLVEAIERAELEPGAESGLPSTSLPRSFVEEQRITSPPKAPSLKGKGSSNCSAAGAGVIRSSRSRIRSPKTIMRACDRLRPDGPADADHRRRLSGDVRRSNRTRFCGRRVQCCCC